MTIKQQVAVKEMVVNGGNATQAMLTAGYSPNTANTPAKLTNSKAVKKQLNKLAKANNVTIEQYMMNLGQAMQADKMNNFTGEITVDHQTRLSANKQAERFLFNDKETDKRGITPEQLKELANESDEVKLTELVFKKE